MTPPASSAGDLPAGADVQRRTEVQQILGQALAWAIFHPGRALLLGVGIVAGVVVVGALLERS